MFNSNTNFNHYKTFIEVYQNRSITKASQKLFLTQPAVSSNIKTLEKQLNCCLFNKSTSKLEPTREADVLYPYILESFSNINKAEQLINIMQNRNDVLIRIGIPSYLFNEKLNKTIKQFCIEYPNVKFEVTSRATPELVSYLNNKNIDILIDSDPVENLNKKTSCIRLGDIENVFVASSNFKGKMNLSQDEFKKYKFILPLTYSKIMQALQNAIGDTRICSNISTWSMEVAIKMIKNNIGIGYVLKNLVEDELKTGQLKLLSTDITLPKDVLNLYYCQNDVDKLCEKFIKKLTYAED